MPNPGTMHVSAPLTGVSAGYSNADLVARRVFPVVTAPKISAKIYTVDAKRARMRIVEDLRAPGAPASILDYRIEKSSIEIPDHSRAQVVPYEDDQNADEVLRDELDPTNALTENLMLQEEARAAAVAFSAALFASYLDETAHKFDQSSGYADPAEVIADACSDILLQIGRRGNCVLVGENVHNAIANNAAIKDRLKYTSGQSVTPEMLKALFRLDDYIVGSASKNTATEDAAATTSFLWPTEKMLVFYRDARPGRKTPTLGYTVVPQNMGQMGVLVEKEQLGQGRLARQITVHRWYYQHLMLAAAGQLHTNCVGAS